MINDKEEFLKNFLKNLLEKSMKGSEFVFDYVYLLYYQSHKINLNRGRSYIDSTGQIKKSDNKSYQ